MDEQDAVVVLPPVPLDPLFAEAVEDALAGEGAATSAHDPAHPVGADPHDFAGLYIRHRAAFAAHGRRFLRDPRDVDEVVQEAFLRLFLALPELGTELQALAYCRRTITNLCIDRYRADQRRPRLVDLDSVPADVLGDEDDDPVVQAEDAAVVRQALALLSPLHRDALVKREIEEKPLPVIAGELGVPEDSVKHLLHRARRALRRHLAGTHLAPGVDLDSTSTLNLLARSAVGGPARLGVLALLLGGLVTGLAGTQAPASVVSAFASVLSRLPDVVALPRAAPPVRRPAATPGPAAAPTPAAPAPFVLPSVAAPSSVGARPVQPPVAPQASATVPAVVRPRPAVTVVPAPRAATATVDTGPAKARPAPPAAPPAPAPSAVEVPGTVATPAPSVAPSSAAMTGAAPRPSASPPTTSSPRPAAAPDPAPEPGAGAAAPSPPSAAPSPSATSSSRSAQHPVRPTFSD